MNLRELAESRIVIDPDVCSGKARIRGTRVTVADILLSQAEGLSEQEILRTHRALRLEDLRAALAYSYCVADGVKLKLGSGAGTETTHQDNSISHSDMTAKVFNEQLEMQAAIQAELTKNKITEVQEEKAKSAAPKQAAPDKRDYEFEINLSPLESLRVFNSKDKSEQALDLKHDAYVFELRDDDKDWLTYSDVAGMEMDSQLKRKIKLSYQHNGELKEAIFDGYLTKDRHHKVFIQRHPDSRAGGRAL